MTIAETTRAVLNKFGFDLHRHRPPAARRTALMTAAEVRTVLDVGANTGQYATELRRSGFDGVIFSFEPLEGAFSHLQGASASDPNWHCRQLALSDRSGQDTIHVAGNSASSSLLTMTSAHREALPAARFVGRQEVTLSRLDTVSGLEDVPDQLMLKLDVQGHEMAALAGATGILHRVVLIEAELSVCELYKGAPLMLQSLSIIADLGFDLVALEPGFHDPRDGRIYQFDGLFLRRELHSSSSDTSA